MLKIYISILAIHIEHSNKQLNERIVIWFLKQYKSMGTKRACFSRGARSRIVRRKPKTFVARVVGVLVTLFGRGDDTVGNPHRAQICQFELLELILLLKLDTHSLSSNSRHSISVNSTVPPPLDLT